MGLRFSKSIKVMDGLKVNLSTSGVSFTVGKKGKSINVGKKGTYVNLGLPGTGVSYRQKLAGGYSSILSAVAGGGIASLTQKKTSKKTEEKKEIKNNTEALNQIEQFNKDYDAYINMHKYTENVHPLTDFLTSIKDEELRKNIIEGDEDTVESLIGNYLESLQLVHEINVNYELEDDVLYVDLDLLEVENIPSTILQLDKNDNVVETEKSKTQLKKDYCQIVESLTIYLASNFFNISPYITQIVLSAYTQRRNKVGDLVNEYIISVKYLRAVFEDTDLTKLTDTYQFICQFDNRINISSDNSLKSITPFDMILSDTKEKSIDFTGIYEGFKRLGYKQEEINKIKDELTSLQFEKEDDYLREGLKLLKKNKLN